METTYKRPRLFRVAFWTGFLFWLWNIVFISFMLFGFVPTILPEMINAARSGFINPRFLNYALIIPFVPVVAAIIGFVWLRREPRRLFALGYGIEAPLMMLMGFRLVLIRDVNPAVGFLILTAAIGILGYGWHLFLTRPENVLPHRLTTAAGWFVTLTILLIVGGYFLLLISFYFPPLLSVIAEALAEIPQALPTWDELRNISLPDLRFIPFFVLGILLFGLTAVLFAMLPIVVSYLYISAWWQSFRSIVRVQGAITAVSGFAVLIALWVGILFVANRQPQLAAFDLLSSQPATFNEVETILNREDALRRGLLNAYLAPYRYLTADGESSAVVEAYTTQFDGLDEVFVNRLQSQHDAIARPLIYRPVNVEHASKQRWGNQVFEAEGAAAAELYQRYFDEPIIEGEQEAIVQAVAQTIEVERGRQAVQAVDDREVYLARQELAILEHGDWAEVELYEVYQNQTGIQQEVVYFFSLPESAVVTGLWLGNSADRDQRFAHRVAPRGAAQEVYQSQVRVRQDPALLEQIGPTQYRLRIFPIEPQPIDWDQRTSRTVVGTAPEMHLWMTFRVLAADAAWPMPRLSEQFNIYWDGQTERLLNGQAQRADTDHWLPESIVANNVANPTTKHVDLGNGRGVIIEPLHDSEALSTDGRLAVILDRSHSMRTLAAEVDVALANLAAFTVDVYQTSSPVRPDAPSRIRLDGNALPEITYFGGQHPSELLQQFYDLQEGQIYDAILVLTDGSGYELGPSELELPASDTPIWFVHLGGEMPIGYDDETLKAIQSSGGGAVGTVAEALQRLAHSSTDGATRLVDQYVWHIVAAEELTAASNEAFAPFAARAIILSEMVRQRQNLDQLEALDELHALAVEHSIATAYSSMIVLVTEQQQRLLDQLEQAEDRFDRAYEAVGETESFEVTGVPEPHEWILLGLSVLLGLWYLRSTPRRQRLGL